MTSCSNGHSSGGSSTVETARPISGFAALKAKFDHGGTTTSATANTTTTVHNHHHNNNNNNMKRFTSVTSPPARSHSGSVMPRHASLAMPSNSSSCSHYNNNNNNNHNENSPDMDGEKDPRGISGGVILSSSSTSSSSSSEQQPLDARSYHVLSPTKSSTAGATTAGGHRRYGSAIGNSNHSNHSTNSSNHNNSNSSILSSLPVPLEEEEPASSVVVPKSSKGPTTNPFGGVTLKSVTRATSMNRFAHQPATNHASSKASVDDSEHDNDDASGVSSFKNKKSHTTNGSISRPSRRESTSCSPSRITSKTFKMPNATLSQEPPSPQHRSVSCSPQKDYNRSLSTGAGRRVVKKGGRKSNREFDGYNSYSSSEGNLSFTADGNVSEESESNDCDVEQQHPMGGSVRAENCHPLLTKSNPKSNSMVPVKKNRDVATSTTTTVKSNTSPLLHMVATTVLATQRLQRKKSGGRPVGGAPTAGKQTVIYTRQAPTILDLPVFVHTDHEEDMILQALYNKEDLFSQLRVGQLKQFVSAFEKYVAPAGDIIISQGDYINHTTGGGGSTNDTSYFYVIHRGIVEFTIDDQHLGTAGVGESFGEFALLYNTPRSITVLALEDVELFRVDALTFRRILSSQTQSCTHKKCRLIESIHFFELIMDECHIADHVVPLSFRPGDVLLAPGQTNDKLFIMGEGVVHRKTKSTGRIDTLAIKQGDYFGERALVGTDVSTSTYVAATRGLAFTMDRTTFEAIVMKVINSSTAALITSAIRNDQMIRRLAVLQFMIQYAEPIQIVTLASLLKDKSYSAGEKVLVEKESVRAALFYVKQGEVTLSTSDAVAKVVPIGGWFGEAHMTKAYSKGKKTTKSMYTVIAKTDCTFSVLTLKDFVSIVAPQLQSTTNLCPEPVQNFAVLELIEEVTESGVEPVVIEQTIPESSKNRGTPAKVSTASIVSDDMVRGSKHNDEKLPTPSKVQRQFSDSSSATATSAILSNSMANDSDHLVKPILTTTTTALTTSVALSQPSQPRRKLPVKRQRQLSFVRVAPLNVKLNQLKKHSILGEGTFGIVWLVSDPTNQKENKYYALKKQSKAFLIGENQVEAVTQEKIMLENMRHPFLIQLEKTYQDECFIYMLLEFVQGGELFSLMHEEESSILPEHQAKFYALCLSDVLDYLRNRKYVYRDLKGENVMLDAKGYVKLIDFGFCKYLLAEKTYTLCGTPGYLSPEMVTVQGHSFSTDNWSLGVLIYEMIAGSSPFYYDGIDQAELFDAIALDEFPPLPDTVSAEAKDLVSGLLQKDPVTRYGSTNQCKIHEHAWFHELDLEAMRHREMEAPWVPYLDGPLDTSNFNDWSELEQAEKDGTIGADGDVSKKGLAVSKRDQKLFEGVF